MLHHFLGNNYYMIIDTHPIADDLPIKKTLVARRLQIKFNVVALAFARFAKAGSAVALLGLVDWRDRYSYRTVDNTQLTLFCMYNNIALRIGIIQCSCIRYCLVLMCVFATTHV